MSPTELAIKPKLSRKIRTGATIPMQAEYADHIWTYDFVFDQTLERTTLKILTLTDEFTRQSLTLQVAASFTSVEVKDVLRDVIAGRDPPAFLRSDNGSEFIARDLGIWLAVQDIGTRFIEPGKTWQNGFAESFHSRLRAECLNQEVFYSVKHAQVLLDDWRAFDNAGRPHSSLDYRTPDEFAAVARGRQAAPWVSHEVPYCTLNMSRVSTRNRPNLGANLVQRSSI